MIEIKTLTKSQLLEFVQNPQFRALEFIPISIHRAISHANNPRAAEEDVLLILAYENNELAGYLGVLPESIFIHKKKSKKCGFLSCLWVDPKHRGKKIAQSLLHKALSTWDHRILVTEFTKEAKGLYDKTNAFKDLTSKKGIRLYIKSDLATILPPKAKKFQRIKALLHFSDTLINVFLKLRGIGRKQQLIHVNYELIDGIQEEQLEFIQNLNSNELFRRSKEELNWLLSFPWISEQEDGLSTKYHFSSVAKKFQFYPYSVRNEMGDMIAFLIFSQRNGTLKLPYAYFESKNVKTVAQFIENQIKILKIKTFTTFNEELCFYFSKHKPKAIHYKKIERNYIISKAFDEIEYNFEIQDGDADCGFT